MPNRRKMPRYDSAGVIEVSVSKELLVLRKEQCWFSACQAGESVKATAESLVSPSSSLANWNGRFFVQEALSKAQFIRDRVDCLGHDPIVFQLER
jgi:hypothetical protein